MAEDKIIEHTEETGHEMRAFCVDCGFEVHKDGTVIRTVWLNEVNNTPIDANWLVPEEEK